MRSTHTTLPGFSLPDYPHYRAVGGVVVFEEDGVPGRGCRHRDRDSQGGEGADGGDSAAAGPESGGAGGAGRRLNEPGGLVGRFGAGANPAGGGQETRIAALRAGVEIEAPGSGVVDRAFHDRKG